ncbi:hypothetical protein PV325_004735 [Microctonus aethiopoides]|nr:hypothetical protein PV325_004735 [Microctonus aethiopoides]
MRKGDKARDEVESKGETMNRGAPTAGRQRGEGGINYTVQSIYCQKTLQAPTTRRRRVPAPKGCDRNGMVVVGGEGAACATRLEALVVRVNATRMGDVDFDVAVTI